MNTRLLMVLHVNIAAPQNIGAVPHGPRRTAPITGGDFGALVFAARRNVPDMSRAHTFDGITLHERNS